MMTYLEKQSLFKISRSKIHIFGLAKRKVNDMIGEAKIIGCEKNAKRFLASLLASISDSISRFIHKSCFTTLLVLLFIFIAWIFPLAIDQLGGANLDTNYSQTIFFEITVGIVSLILIVQIYARHKWPMKAKYEAKKAIERKMKESQIK
jgi:hypothetical protein